MNSFGRLSLAFLSICFIFGFGVAGYLWIDAPSTVYEGCYQPYTIKMNSSGAQTAAVDAKLFLSGYFSLSHPYLNLADLTPGSSGPASYDEGIFTTTALLTGLSTSGTVIGGEYFYINTYNNPHALTGGEGLSLITLYLRANDYTTGYLDFYFAAPYWNGDDSNITSGYNSHTQYADALGAVVNGEYTIDTSYACDYRPFASGANYRFTGYIRTTTGYEAVWTSVIAGPIYTCTDTTRCPYTNSTGWTLWSKDPVLLSLFGATNTLSGFALSGIQFLYVSTLDGTYPASIAGDNLNVGWYNERWVIFTGNVETGYIAFVNILGNSGNTYLSGTPYDYILYTDMFWLDTVKPDDNRFFTGYLYASGGAGSGGYQTFLLTVGDGSYGSSDAVSGWHSATSIKDDEFMIIGFSGYNEITQYEYASGSNTAYMEWLNTTGYLWSGVNDFVTGHYLTFNSPWSGWVYFIDRAGNTGQFFLDSSPEVALTYMFKVWPQQYNAGGGSLDRRGLSGMLVKIAIYNGYNPSNIQQNLVYTGRIKTNILGEGSFSGINLGNFTGEVLAEGVFTVGGLLTGVLFDQGGGLIDYTTGYYYSGLLIGNFYNTTTNLGDLFGYTIVQNNGISRKHSDYVSMANGGSQDEEINGVDLARFVPVLVEFGKYNAGTNEAGVFDNAFFVDSPVAGSTLLSQMFLSSITGAQLYMQYHSYDLNANGDVDTIDFARAAANAFKTGYRMPF